MKTAKQIIRRNQVNNVIKFYVWLFRLIIAIAAISFGVYVIFS